MFAIRQGFELVALHPQHGIIVVGPWQDIKTFATADTCVFAMHVHLAFITKYRHRVFDGDAIKKFEGCSPNSLKGVCSRILRQERPDLAARHWKGVLWSRSYFAASCGGAPTFCRTISDNRKHHSEKRAYIPALKDRGFTPERVNREEGLRLQNSRCAC